jgi:hypothetical protein
MMYRDPIFDGPTDPVVMFNHETGDWWMFYTQRRATVPGPGVAWVHGTDIGVAISSDGGTTWLYRGVVEGLDFEIGRNTFWAPEIFLAHGQYHMLVSYITGVPDRWEGYPRSIRHYVSTDLWTWTDRGCLDLGSGYVIDAAVYPLPSGGYRLWYKDEAHQSHTYTADSIDLKTWSWPTLAIGGDPHEGPNVFRLGGWYWLITDEWRGLAVYRSADLTSWERNGMILSEPGLRPDDADVGRHADVAEHDGRAYIFYFTHPDGLDARRSCVLAAELQVANGQLTCDRDNPPHGGFLVPGGAVRAGAVHTGRADPLYPVRLDRGLGYQLVVCNRVQGLRSDMLISKATRHRRERRTASRFVRFAGRGARRAGRSLVPRREWSRPRRSRR